MLKKRTIIALAFAVVVGGIAAYLLTRPDPHVKKGTVAKGVPEWPLASAPGKTPPPEVDELEIAETGKDPVVLKKSGAEWRLVKPIEDRADAKAVATATGALGELRLRDVIAESPESYEKVGVADAQSTRVTARGGGKDLATILLGKSTNVRLPGDPKVYSTSGLKRHAFVKELKLWRDREIARFEKDQLDRVEIAYADGRKLSFKRVAPPAEPPKTDEHGHEEPKASVPDRYEIVEGQELIGGPLDEQVTTAIVTSLMRLDAVDFPASAEEAAARMANPRAAVTIKLKDGAQRTIIVGATEGEDAWLKSSDKDRVFKVRKLTAENLIKPPLQWRDKLLAKIPSTEVARVEVVKGAERAVMERPDPNGDWKLTTPADAPDIDVGKLNMLAGAFQSFRAASIHDGPATPDMGFARPTAVVTVTKKDGTKHVITVGANKDKSYFVKVSGKDEVFLVGEMVANRIMKTAADLKKTAPQAAPGGAHAPMPGMPGAPRPPGG